MFIAINKRMRDHDGGFTLIELLVVVIIIGILAAIAIPTFMNQRERAWVRAAQSDVRNAAIALEDYFTVDDTYVGAVPEGNLQANHGFRPSDNVTTTLPTLTATTYCIQAVHASAPGADQIQHLLSTTGQVSNGACPAP